MATTSPRAIQSLSQNAWLYGLWNTGVSDGWYLQHQEDDHHRHWHQQHQQKRTEGNGTGISIVHSTLDRPSPVIERQMPTLQGVRGLRHTATASTSTCTSTTRRHACDVVEPSCWEIQALARFQLHSCANSIREQGELLEDIFTRRRQVNLQHADKHTRIHIHIHIHIHIRTQSHTQPSHCAPNSCIAPD
jgi:hypothetical protein